MRYLSLGEILELYQRVMATTGGSAGIRDWGLLRSAIAQPRMGAYGEDFYPTLVEKAASLCYSLVMNHPMVDGNKRLGHAAMELFLMLNGYELDAPVDEQERLMLDLAAGEIERPALVRWVQNHVVKQAEG